MQFISSHFLVDKFVVMVTCLVTVEEKLGALSRVKSEVRGIKTLSVTSDTFANLEEKTVPVDDVFLHR